MDEIKKGDYVVFKPGKSMIADDKRLETRFLVASIDEKSVAIMAPEIGIMTIERDRLELAPNQKIRE